MRRLLPLLALSLLSMGPIPAEAAPAYTVRKSDGLWTIARRCGLGGTGVEIKASVARIRALNPLVEQGLKPGMVLRMPTDSTCDDGSPADGTDSDSSVMATADSGETWRPYGPLQVSWDDWDLEGEHWITTVRNSQKKPLYLAVNCPSRKLTNTLGLQGDWKPWRSAEQNFEKNLMGDLCTEKA
ncbi:MAG: LysM peptidoglycan-binding domain-containing protein [Aphanocapsa feldmannii 277cV]|uniref:LysM peptidoglycan-binding domain-containing protein n=2 Tax=Aphanocapsa feldmannii TaxID=192050 RepID=A0A524RQ32_9CHRO|nr:MAG: LysM peptidoglycan-binding domain-containing protein [Aphanocapsa feldmannii 277cV]TGH25073.1 MAG: LysM peptidoglycan-binding domain-containing protein [Aphanocapsa feldmannii 277cI]